MAIELSGLAARLKAGIDKAAAEQEAAERAAEQAEAHRISASAETLEAQQEMLDALEGLAKSVGAFKVTKGKLWVQMVREGKGLRFVAVRDDAVPTDHIQVRPATKTDSEVGDHHLTRDELLEWEVVLAEASGPRRLPVELGLEELLNEVLGLAAEPAVPPVPSSSSEAKVPPAPTAPSRPERRRRRGAASAAPPGSGLRALKGPLD